MKIKKDDNVIVIAGKDRGKTGKVVRALPRQSAVIIAGVHVRKVHKRATKSGKKGEVVDQAFPIHISNIMIVDPKTGKGTRTGVTLKGKEKTRIAKKSGESIK
jgi:large subunit ribosomal protein L24